MAKKFNKERLEQVMEERNLNRNRFAKLIGVSPYQLKKYLDDGLKPNLETFERILKKTGKSANFFFS